MCGRYMLTAPVDAVRMLFDLAGVALSGPMPNLAARYNIAPTQAAPVVRRDPQTGARALVSMRWGLVPSWSKGPDSRYTMINARAETVASKPAYRGAYRSRRCLVPANGFYEWRAAKGGKQPHLITLNDGALMAFAGLWEAWRDPTGATLLSFTITVTDANALLRPIHERMPVIVAPENYAAWLAADPPPDALLAPYPAEAMVVRPVSRRVNSPAHDDPALLASIDEPDAEISRRRDRVNRESGRPGR